jgi:KTSC domain
MVEIPDGKRQSNRRLGRSRTPAYSVSMGVVSAVEWIPVESGLFSSAAYRAGVRQLYLRFQDGKIYRFFDCPVTVYTEFVATASKGRYFSQQIRNHFRYEMVRRGKSGNRHCASPQPCLAEQLKASVVLAKARAVPQRDMTEAAGAQEGAGFNGYAQPKPLE